MEKIRVSLGFKKHVCFGVKPRPSSLAPSSRTTRQCPLYSTHLLRGNGLDLALVFLVAAAVVVVMVLSVGRESYMAEKETGSVAMACMHGLKKEEFTLEKRLDWTGWLGKATDAIMLG